MTDIHELSNTELAKALRCCSAGKLDDCANCDCRYMQNCSDILRLEAAERIESIVSIQAARDAMAKELKKHGVVL